MSRGENTKQWLMVPVSVISAIVGVVVFYFIRAEQIDAKYDGQIQDIRADLSQYKTDQATTIGQINASISGIQINIDNISKQNVQTSADIRAIMSAFGVKRP